MASLHHEFSHGELSCVENSLQFLAKKRADLEAGDNFRVTGLHLAAIEHHYDVCKFLLEHRTEVAPRDTENDTPLHWAATKGHSDVSGWVHETTPFVLSNVVHQCMVMIVQHILYLS